MLEHEAIVQRGAPAHRLAVERRAPERGDERAQEQLLRQAHARIGRHLERAEFDQAQPAGRAVGRKQFVDADLGAMGVAGDVDQNVAEQAVDQPRRHPVVGAGRRHLADGDVQFVEQILARLVDARRLAGRADEQSAKQIGQRRPPQRIQDETLQEIGPAQKRAVGRVQAAEHHMIAAAGAGVAAVDHEFVGAEPRAMAVLVDRLRDLDGLAPRRRRLDVDLDDAGIGRDFEHIEPRIGRRPIAFDVNRQIERSRGRLDGGEQIEIIRKLLGRRHEDADVPVAHFDGQRRAHRHCIGSAVRTRRALHDERFGRQRRRRLLPRRTGGGRVMAGWVSRGSDNGRRSANGSAGTRCG